jgi:hypothetical protein
VSTEAPEDAVKRVARAGLKKASVSVPILFCGGGDAVAVASGAGESTACAALLTSLQAKVQRSAFDC